MFVGQFHKQKYFYYYYHLASVDLDQEMRPGSVFDASTSTTDPSRKGYFMDYENKRPKRPKLRPPPPRGGPQVYGGKGNNNNRRREPNRRTQNDNIPGWRKFLPNLPSLPDLLSLRDTVFPNKRNDRPPPLPPKIPPRPQNSIRTSNRPNLQQQQQHHHNPLKRPPLLTSLNSFEQTSSEDLPPIGKNHALNI